MKDISMNERARKVLLSMVATLLFTSGCVAGEPYFNLRWFLQDVVATTLIGREAYEELRSLGPFEAEMLIRERTEQTATWVMRRPNSEHAVEDTSCDAFTVRTFTDWQSDMAQDLDNVPQWREAFHGASVLVDFRSGYRGVKHVHLAAAVPSPGIPKSAFVSDGSGGLKFEFFDAAGTYTGAGFDNMREAMLPLNMSLTRNETCEGYEFYLWEFQR